MSTPPTPRSSPPVQMPHVRRDYSIAFSEKFPGLGVSNNVTAIFMELTAAYNVQLTVSLATVAFGHGVEGLWLLPPAQAQAETETVAKITKSECLTNCFKAISKACPGKWVGIKPFHMPITDQFNWVRKHCGNASGLWIDDTQILHHEGPTVPKQVIAAKGVWQAVTAARAVGKWDGIYFGGLTPTQFRLCETKEIVQPSEGSVPTSNPSVTSNPNAFALQHLGVAATFLMDAMVVTSDTDIATLRLRSLQPTRPALLFAAPTLDLTVLSGISPYVEAIILCQSSLTEVTTPTELTACLNKLMNQPSDDDMANADIDRSTDTTTTATTATEEHEHEHEHEHETEPPQEQHVKQLQQTMHKLIRVGLEDKRVIYGRLSCTDRDMNLILRDCDEFAPEVKSDKQPNSGGDTNTIAEGKLVFRRHLGLTMIPGYHITTVAIEHVG